MKKHTIEVDAEVFEALQELATPLVDTPNSVLRRLLIEGPPGPMRISTVSMGLDVPSPRAPIGRAGAQGAASAWSQLSRPLRETPEAQAEAVHVSAPAGEPGPYASLGDERRAPAGMSPRRFGKILCAREFPGEMFERARRDRGSFRTMFESAERILYFLNFNKPGATNLWYKVNATALEALLGAEKPAFVVFTNPAERLAWVIPIADLSDAYRRYGGRALGDGDLDVNFDVERNRVRELDWSVREYRREV